MILTVGILLVGELQAQPTDTAAPSGAGAQLIVRLADDAPDALRTRLNGTVAKSTPDDPLFDGVASSEQTFPTRDLRKSGTSRPPIPAYTLTVMDSTALRRLSAAWSDAPGVEYVQFNDTFQLDAASQRDASSLSDAGENGREEVRHGKRDDGPPTLSPNNLLADSLDHLRVVRANEAWPITSGSRSVRIGILDSGVYLDHPDLQGALWVNPGEDLNGNGRLDASDRNGVDDDGNGYVDDVVGYDFVDRRVGALPGEFQDRDPDPSPDPDYAFSIHGTTVAGVAGASAGDRTQGIYGVAPGASLVPLRAFGGTGIAETDDIAAAIVYAADTGIDVLNMSFGRDFPAPLIEDAIEYAAARDVVMVASAGNDGSQNPHYPSDYPEVVSVLWLAEDGQGVPQQSISQFGVGIDVGAPGSRVYTSLFPRGAILNDRAIELDDLYLNVSGSSYSAPQVSGAAALLRSLDPSLSPGSIRSILSTSATDLAEENWDHVTGAGLLNTVRALSRAAPARTELLRPEANGGVTGERPVPVVGTVLDPAFRSYSVFYAEGDVDLGSQDAPWIPVVESVERQVLRDTLATWDVTALPDTLSLFTLRLVTTLVDGRTIEDRRRVRVDGTPPRLTVERLESGVIRDRNGVVASIFTDDPGRTRLRIRLNGRETWLDGEFEKKRSVFSWPDPSGAGGQAEVRVVSENAAGLTTTLDTTLTVAPRAINSGYLRRTSTEVPRGRLMPVSTDFDRDGLREVVLNEIADGGNTDSVRVYEWTPDGFAQSDSLVASFLPKDVGDTDGDGRQELLLQFSAATLLLEQETTDDPLPSQEVLFDTEFINNPGDSAAFFATRLADLDRDGRDEIIGKSNFEWKIRTRDGDAFPVVQTLSNPTELFRDTSFANVFGANEALVGDFDADDRTDLLVGDRDGDFLVYESRGDDQMELAWTFETDRFDGGTRFASGDFDGDGASEFVTFTSYYPLVLRGIEADAAVTDYYVFDSAGDDDYRLDARLPISVETTFGSRSEGDDGALAAADFDGDGRDEIAVVHPPSLYVFDRTPGAEWQVVYHAVGENTDAFGSPLSRSLVTDDFDGDGRPELVLSTNGETLDRYVLQPGALASPVPQWTTAVPTGPDGVRLAWRADGADSVQVFDAAPDGALDPLVTVTGATEAVLDETRTRRYALRAFRNETPSPLSELRTVRPHPPAVVDAVRYPGDGSVRIVFTEPLSPEVDRAQFLLDGTPATRLIQAEEGRAVQVSFGKSPRGRLTWRDVDDATGLAVAQTEVVLEGPKADVPSFIVTAVDVADERNLRVTFSASLAADASSLVETDGVVSPSRGRIVDVAAEEPNTLIIQFDGIVIGATNIESSIRLPELRSEAGGRLDEESRVVQLDRPATTLDDVFVYPNPHRTREHGDALTIAGLPTEATVRIYSPDGRLVRVLEVDTRSGGREWDLRDRRGQRVPSGVYLIRVESPDLPPVLRKAAVID